ncbi:MAG: class I SAM-dependent methyltransferase, partial [Pirellulaceae bacterium]|nr:class I SAM-dependent methyltransferase [Pirellulaceae bacterium]
MSNISEEQIRPADLMADKQHCVDADRNFLLERRERWVAAACPACGCSSAQPYGQKQGFAYEACCECRTIYTNPRPSLDLLHEFYSQSQNYAYWNEHIYPATEQVRRERIFAPRAERLAGYCEQFGLRGGTLLEVGAAFGTFCEEVRKLDVVDRIVALEPTPALAQTCRQRGFEVLEQFVEDVSETEFADVVAAFEVLEHLFSPKDFLNHCRRMLRPGGIVILSCPNGRGFDVATLGTQSGTFDHEHINYFNPQSLSVLMSRCGLETLDAQTPGEL